MTFLIDILHPAHVHFFRPLYQQLIAQGHRVIVTARRKEMSCELLDSYAIPYRLISHQRSGVGLIFEMVVRSLRLGRICLQERPVLMMGIMGPSIAVVGRFLGIRAWIFYDTENAWITNWFAYPLAHRLYTPRCYIGTDRRNQLRYSGYHELAYLHPAYFTPNPDVLSRHGIDPAERFCLVRFVGWQASHDVGEQGLSLADKMRIVERLEQYGRVFITSEAPLPAELESKRLPVGITEIHHLLAYAALLVGESATMASEAAVLGVPALFISDTSRGYTLEQEKNFQLVFNLTRGQIDKALQLIDYVLSNPNSRNKFRSKRDDLLAETIDVTSYMLNEIKLFTRNNH